MKVTFLAGTLGRGGAERQLLLMLKALKNCSIPSRVLSLTADEPIEQEILDLGVPVEYVGKGSRAARAARIVSTIRRDRPDVVQSAHFFSNLYIGLAGRMLSVPSIGAVRNDFRSEVRAHGWLGYWQVNMPEYLIANSAIAYDRAVGSGVVPGRIEFVRNVVCAPQVNKKRSRTLNVLFAGRLHEDKSPHRFLELADAMLRRFPEVPLKFRIAGDGPLRPTLELQAAELGLSPDKFEFLGGVSDMQQVYDETEILVSTSCREGTPNVILEAMANGLAVVAMRAGGIPELFGTDRGLLVDQDDQLQLESAVARLIRDKCARARLGSEAKAYAERHHSLSYLERRLPEIYQKCIRNER